MLSTDLVVERGAAGGAVGVGAARHTVSAEGQAEPHWRGALVAEFWALSGEGFIATWKRERKTNAI